MHMGPVTLVRHRFDDGHLGSLGQPFKYLAVVCRRLAQMLGGRISVQSQVGKGSTFTLTLPTKGRK